MVNRNVERIGTSVVSPRLALITPDTRFWHKCHTFWVNFQKMNNSNEFWKLNKNKDSLRHSSSPLVPQIIIETKEIIVRTGIAMKSINIWFIFCYHLIVTKCLINWLKTFSDWKENNNLIIELSIELFDFKRKHK